MAFKMDSFKMDSFKMDSFNMDNIYTVASNATAWSSQKLQKLPPAPPSWAPYIATGVVGYIGLCSILRFRNLRKKQAQLNFTDSESLSRMTIADAQNIVSMSLEKEFPFMYEFSLRIALFKTYAVEGVAQLLAAHSDLSKRDQSAKRYEDTAVLYTCFASFNPSSDEFIKAVSRMNFLHNPYIKAGKITNGDLLYVLWASMAEPVKFMQLYEWRAFSDMEHAALGTLWLHVGRLMSIDYKKELGKDKWANGKVFMDELTEWARGYEGIHMKPSPEVSLLGDVLMELLLSVYPKFTRSTVRQVSLVLMTEQMRWAFGLPEPGIGTRAFVNTVFLLRKLVIRYLCLPRMSAVKYLSKPNPKTGRMHHYPYLKEPWYSPKTVWSRWGPIPMVSWVLGLPRPGDQGQEFKPDGFLFEDIGPKNRVGRGLDEMGKIQKEIRNVPVSCPFSSKV